MKKLIEKDSANLIGKFFKNKNWQPLDFQIESWESYLRGESGIIEVPTGFGKTYAALMGPLLKLKELDKWIRKNTLERYGPVRSVKPELVFEISFDNIQFSKRHKSGIALRFPRITKWRKDKNIMDADNLENAISMIRN